MSALRVLVNVGGRAGIFKRNRRPLEVKVLEAVLCFAGLSYRGGGGYWWYILWAGV
jgi:hypothetical protein